MGLTGCGPFFSTLAFSEEEKVAAQWSQNHGFSFMASQLLFICEMDTLVSSPDFHELCEDKT